MLYCQEVVPNYREVGTLLTKLTSCSEHFRGRHSGSWLYSCYFLRMGVGLVHIETLPDNEGKKKAKRQVSHSSHFFLFSRLELFVESFNGSHWIIHLLSMDILNWSCCFPSSKAILPRTLGSSYMVFGDMAGGSRNWQGGQDICRN